jgi:hypothetical protein
MLLQQRVTLSRPVHAGWTKPDNGFTRWRTDGRGRIAASRTAARSCRYLPSRPWCQYLAEGCGGDARFEVVADSCNGRRIHELSEPPTEFLLR